MLLQKLFKSLKGKEDNDVKEKEKEIPESKIYEITEFLKSGKSLNKMDKEGILECSRKAFKNRAEKIGYYYSSEHNLFIKLGEVIPTTTEVLPRANKEIEIKKDNDDLKPILERLETLELQVKELILGREKETPTSDFEANFEPLNGDIVLKSIKVNAEIYKEFNELLESKFKASKKQDIISYAFKEFIEKYK